jgi:hypothetical protein
MEREACRGQLLQGVLISCDVLTLRLDAAIPVESKCFQSAQDFIRAAGQHPGSIEVLDANQPAATAVTRIEIATECSDE